MLSSTQLLKKSKLDPSLFSSYGAISFSKILQNIVAKQLTAVLGKYSILDNFQTISR